MRTRLFFVFCFVLLCVSANAQMQVSETKYDYSSVSQQITSGKNTKMEQAKCIYQWLCQNIAYDTNYQIFTADECWDNKRGVCQAYCELFYRLGEPIGLNTVIISGKSKDLDGKIGEKGHSWLLAEVEGGWILIDPTWGAGGVVDNEFKRKENDMSWFQVDPYWMIYTHFPDEERFQFLDNPISWEAFQKLPSLYPAYGDFGWQGKDIFNKVLSGEIHTFPQLYEDYAQHISLVEVPVQETLRPGKYYEFYIRKKKNEAIALIHDDEFVYESEWKRNGNDYWLRYMPVSAGTLKISIAQGEDYYSTAVCYQIAAPNPQELKNIEQERPFRMPEMKQVKNLDVKHLEMIGVSGHDLLAEIRSKHISSLPILYLDAEKYLSKVKIPLSETLYVGKTYTFSFVPLGGIDWQIINEGDWYGEWNVDQNTGRITIQVTPQNVGKLKLSVQLKEGGSYSTTIGYQVEEL